MSVQFRTAAAAILAAVAAAPLGAQAAGGCQIDVQSPRELALAQFQLQRAEAVTTPQDKARALQAVVKALTEKPDAFRANQGGRYYLLGRALTMHAVAAAPTYTATRGDVGYTTAKEQRVDLLAAVDSAYTMLAQTTPTCAADAQSLRMDEPWRGIIGSSLNLLNAGQGDSAAVLARRSLAINPTSPYAFHVLANAARLKNDNADALTNWRRVVELTKGDTLMGDVRRSALFWVGQTVTDQASTAPAAERRARAAEAVTSFETYIAESPTSPDAPLVQGRLAELYQMTGDTAKVAALYARHLASPDEYSDLALAQAGVLATRTGRHADAAKLYEASLRQNPNLRDALYNLASSYLDLNRHRDMIPVLTRLVALDPNNADNYLLYAYAYQGLGKAATAQAQKRAFTDSLLAYRTRSERLPVVVKFTAFDRGESATKATVEVENRGTTAKSFAIAIEFLDKSGAVLGRQTATVGPIAPKAKRSATVELPQGGAVAVRYAPVT